MRERLRQGPYANFTFKACRNRDGMRHEVHNLNKTVREEKTRVSDIYNGECFPESTNTNPLSQPECYDEVDGILVMNIKTSVTDNCPPSVPSSVTRNDNLDHRRHLLPLPVRAKSLSVYQCVCFWLSVCLYGSGYPFCPSV